MQMKILFIGLGSIAKRHIKNIMSIGIEVTITVMRSGKGGPIPQDIYDCVDEVCLSDKNIGNSYDVVFITNPTSLHYETLKKFLNIGKSFFIEKPVFVTGEEEIGCFLSTDKIMYVACPLRYSNVIQWLKSNIDFSKVFSMRVISSSYLPDWRSGVDYRNTYSAHRALGGGVSIDLIHEWDYISYLIGFPDTVKTLISRKSNLEIDSDDIAIYIAEYDKTMVEVHLDYFGKKSMRKIELFTDEDTIVADLIEQRIDWLKSGKRVDLSQERNAYQKQELSHFFDIVSGKCINDSSIEDACKVLRIAKGVV